jgi:hypothetical protein
MGGLGNNWGRTGDANRDSYGDANDDRPFSLFPFRFAIQSIPWLRCVPFSIAVLSRVSSADSESDLFNDWVTDMISSGGNCGPRRGFGGRAL